MFFTHMTFFRSLHLHGHSQPAFDVSGTSVKGPMKVLKSGTYREPSVDFHGTNEDIDNLTIKLYKLCYVSILMFCW